MPNSQQSDPTDPSSPQPESPSPQESNPPETMPATVPPPALSLPANIPPPPSRANGAPADGSEATAAWTPSSDELPERQSLTSGSSRESSTADSRGNVRDVLAGLIGALVMNAGVLAHTYLTTTDEQRAMALWIPDDDDQEGITTPATSILARRGVAGAVTGDASDLLDLGVAVAGYGMKQLTRIMAARAMRKQAEADPATQIIPGQVQS